MWNRQARQAREYWRCAVLAAAVAVLFSAPGRIEAQSKAGAEYRVLATARTSTMERELNQAAETGFRFQHVMGGETAIGGNEVVVIVSRRGEARSRFAYRLLATSRTSTMEKELQQAADAGFEYRGQTVFDSAFGGEEVVCILERDKDAEIRRFSYKLVATAKTSTLEKEIGQAAAAGYELLGMTVAKTALGGNELVAILRRPVAP